MKDKTWHLEHCPACLQRELDVFEMETVDQKYCQRCSYEETVRRLKPRVLKPEDRPQLSFRNHAGKKGK